jgi:hypothetical protein
MNPMTSEIKWAVIKLTWQSTTRQNPLDFDLYPEDAHEELHWLWLIVL